MTLDEQESVNGEVNIQWFLQSSYDNLMIT